MRMQRRNAALNAYYFVLILLGVLCSAVSRRLEPACVVLPLAAALLYSRVRRPTPALTLHCHITPLRAFEGDRLTIALTVHAQTALPRLELWHLLPPGVLCVTGANRVLCTLRAGDVRTFHHEVVCAQRGKYTLGQVYGRIHPDTDLQPLLLAQQATQVCHIYPRITPLPPMLLPHHTHASFGHYVATSTGEGLEFAGVRPYSSGDRLRRVHWRTTLAQQQLYVNEYYCERNADVVLLLDTLVSVGREENTTLDIAVRAAASLAAHYLHHKDRVGLLQYGGVCTWVAPAIGQSQLYRLLDALLDTHTHFSYLTKDIALIPPRVLPPGALIFVLTTLMDARLETTVHDLLARRFQLVLIVLSPLYAMAAPRQRRQADATARLWQLEMDMRLEPFRRLGIPVILQTSEDPLEGLHALTTHRRLGQRLR